MNNDLKILIVNEGNAKSIITDIFTFGCLLGSFFINYQFLGNSTLITLLICVLFFMEMFQQNTKKIKRMTPREAYEYLKIQQGVQTVEDEGREERR
jgi:hypothetical protein